MNVSILTRKGHIYNSMLIRADTFLSHVSLHTDSKDFKDVGFADYAYRLFAIRGGASGLRTGPNHPYPPLQVKRKYPSKNTGLRFH